MIREDQALSLSNRSLRSALAQCRADLAAARKWAKLWKMQATGERIQKEQAAKAFCDEATKRELSQESNHALRAEIERLNGRRCDGCAHAQIEIIDTDGSGYRAFCSKHVTTFRIDHYCKNWEKR